MISLLVASRKNSKTLSKLLSSIKYKTEDSKNVEVLVMLNSEDTWNKDIIKNFEYKYFYENWHMGRGGLHEYYNELYKYCYGDWIMYLCDDHDIIMNKWDIYLKRALEPYNSQMIYCYVPRADNTGSVVHMLSKGWVDTLGGSLGHYGNIDSYINDTIAKLYYDDRIIHGSDAIYTDYTVDPTILTKEHNKTEVTKEFPIYDSPEIKAFINDDAQRLIHAIQGGL